MFKKLLIVSAIICLGSFPLAAKSTPYQWAGGGIKLVLPGSGWQVKQTRRSFLARLPGKISLSLKLYKKGASSPDSLAQAKYGSYKMVTNKRLVRKHQLKTAAGYQSVTYVAEGQQQGKKVILGFTGILNSKTGKYYYLKCFWKDKGKAGNRRYLKKLKQFIKSLK